EGDLQFRREIVDHDIEFESQWKQFYPPEIIEGDLDGDGDLDRVSGSQVAEARLIGDSNNDGRFDSADLMHVFSFGQYEDGIYHNSDFTSGDWNGDKEFTSADIVLAFQSGNYVIESRMAAKIAAAIDDPADSSFKALLSSDRERNLTPRNWRFTSLRPQSDTLL
ncbi:MAG: hypothetical protein KDB27_04220, partial [Planctomycetales bacterium]|nr:hypothetical protein [Planctomycetales bacterium]